MQTAKLIGEFRMHRIMFKNKRILLGVSGGIAAYKTPELVRLLKKSGAEVQVICTPSALQFVTLKTLSVVSERPALVDFFDADSGMWNHHVELGLWADAMVVAPCGSNTLSKMVSGQCDNLLLTTYLSARCPVWIAPAMDLDMYQHPSVQEHLQTLQLRGVHLIDAEEGPLASGLEGKGRMAEPAHIVDALNTFFEVPNNAWKGKTVLVNAGPTYEPIDPVRFIGNRSSGLMGIEICNALIQKGAEVILVLGPSHLPVPENATTIRVETALEMFEACNQHFGQCDVGIFAAAVSDYRVAQVSQEKIKKNHDSLQLDLVKNPDILSHLSQTKKAHQRCIGFALETHNAEAFALEKLERKNLDAIVMNTVGENSGFQSTQNSVVIFTKNEPPFASNVQSKSDIAVLLLEKLEDWHVVE
jgi:phosphopantothenoylcysteine decarboxylase/phosphopantothenate--cysteine ligase